MAITKNFIQLTPDSGDSYVPEIKLLSKTDFTAYVIDGEFTTAMCAPSMSGSDFEEMKEIVFKQEFKDKSTPIFYFSQSKTFCINLVPAYFAACFSTPSTAIGLFQPTVVELHKTTGTSVVGELLYDGNKLYLSLPSMTRGSQNASTHIKNGSTVIANPMNYGYDIDKKQPTKIVTTTSGWKFSENGSTSSSKSLTFRSTDDYVFKCTATQYVLFLSFGLGSVSDVETTALFQPSQGSSSVFTHESGGDNSAIFPANQNTALESKYNLPRSILKTGSSPLSVSISKILTPQVISSTNASYICYTTNLYGRGEIFTLDKSNSLITSSGSSYSAIGACNADDANIYYNLGLRIVAKSAVLANKTSIIKLSGSGGGVTVSSESLAYKVTVASSYYALESKSSSSTQDDQSFMYIPKKVVGKQNLILSGFLQCVSDTNNQALSNSYATGVVVSWVNGGGSWNAKIYVLYDDNSIAISSFNVGFSSSNSTCPIKISSDGKNATAYRPYLSKTYTGSVNFPNKTVATGLPADDAFIVPDNSSNSRKIEAIGVVYESGDRGTAYQFPKYILQDGTFLILEPKV